MTTQEIANVTDYDTGLEDFDADEASVPRVTIAHTEGVFKDGQSGEEFPVIHAVILGLIKQRTMWPKTVENDTRPQCKSNDAEVGYPNVTGPDDSLFPWDLYGKGPESAIMDEFGRPTLKCAGCPFAEWTQGKNGKSVAPLCSERHTFPILYTPEEGGRPDRAGIISFQRSGIGPSKQYLSSFKRSKSPLFVAITKISLDRHVRGQVKYSTPVFARGASTDKGDWEQYAKDYRGLREFLRREPRPSDDAVAAAAPKVAEKAPAPAPQAAEIITATVLPAQPTAAAEVVNAVTVPVTQPAPQVVVSPVDDDEDLPF